MLNTLLTEITVLLLSKCYIGSGNPPFLVIQQIANFVETSLLTAL